MLLQPQTNQTAAHSLLRSGGVIPAQPLALTADREFDERRQRALVRYHLESGSVGLAVAVHSTQFSIHTEHRELLSPLLELVAETTAEYERAGRLLIAGATGSTRQAVATAELAAGFGFDFVLLSGFGSGDLTEEQLLERAAAVAEVLPVVGFYLQPAVGGRPLSTRYWQALANIPGVVGIKIAPFDRYATLDVMHGVARSTRRSEVALYTGNDDTIVTDLVSSFPAHDEVGQQVEMAFVGGLLGQWAVWTSQAVAILELARLARQGDTAALAEVMTLSQKLTDANGAIFDARHRFRGVIPGVHEVLRRHGLLAGTWLLDENEVLSPGQFEEIDRIWHAYPELRDDAFIDENLDRWLS